MNKCAMGLGMVSVAGVICGAMTVDLMKERLDLRKSLLPAAVPAISLLVGATGAGLFMEGFYNTYL